MESAAPPACDHIGLFTNNAERLVRFYREQFGFEVEKEEVLAAAVMRAIFGLASACLLIKLAPGGGKNLASTVQLEIFQPLEAAAGRRRNGAAGYNHWGCRVGDREGFANLLAKRGVPVIEVRRNSHRVFFVKDPDGNRIELRR